MWIKIIEIQDIIWIYVHIIRTYVRTHISSSYINIYLAWAFACLWFDNWGIGKIDGHNQVELTHPCPPSLKKATQLLKPSWLILTAFSWKRSWRCPRESIERNNTNIEKTKKEPNKWRIVQKDKTVRTDFESSNLALGLVEHAQHVNPM